MNLEARLQKLLPFQSQSVWYKFDQISTFIIRQILDSHHRFKKKSQIKCLKSAIISSIVRVADELHLTYLSRELATVIQ